MGLERMLGPYGLRTRVEGDLLVAEPRDAFEPDSVPAAWPAALQAADAEGVRWSLAVGAPSAAAATADPLVVSLDCEETSAAKGVEWHRLATRAQDAPLARCVPGDRVRLQLRVGFPTRLRGAAAALTQAVVASGAFTVPDRFASWNGEGVVALLVPLAGGAPLTVSLIFARSTTPIEGAGGAVYLWLVHFEALGRLSAE